MGGEPGKAAETTAERFAESFGFRTVAAAERQGLVNEVFSTVAERYDLMNDLMSGGMHRLWREDLINWLAPPRSATPYMLVDVAGGTADMALRFAAASGVEARAVVCDISPEMLRVGTDKVRRADLSSRISLVVGNAEALPFPSSSFDAYTIAFGIRNVARIDRALAEARRVLRPGGRFLCLECSHVDVPILDRLYDLHSFEVLPRLGQLAAGAAEPYRYLAESIRRFPRQPVFAEMIGAAGLERVEWRNLSGGVAAIHSGWRL